MHKARRAAGAVLGVLTTLLLTTAGSGAVRAATTSAAGDHPPGNNGTVKIDEFTMDSGQDNDPHVGCGFSVLFFGYDGGAQSATLLLTPWSPTSGGHPYHGSTSWNVGKRTSGSQFDQAVQVSQAQLDANNTFAGITPAHSGFHVKLEVEVTGSQGSDDKFKVFWINCPTNGSGGSKLAGQTTTTTSTTSSTTSTTSTTLAAALSSNTSHSTASTRSSGPTSATSAQVVGLSATAGGPEAAAALASQAPLAGPAKAVVAHGTLAFTGVDSLLVAGAGLALVLSGSLILLRRRSRHGTPS